MHSNNIFCRSEMLLGKEYYKKLSDKLVCIFGLGGVGGYVAEILTRSGIVNFILVDGDTIDVSNINRQLIALHSTLGKSKAELFKTRMLDINPKCNIEIVPKFLLPESCELVKIINTKPDYIIDAVDTIALKIALAKTCENHNINLISATGCGNRIEAKYIFSDIYKTSHCPVCKILRNQLKKASVKALKVLYSPSKFIKINPPASVPWTPAIAGIMLAEKVIKDLLEI